MEAQIHCRKRKLMNDNMADVHSSNQNCALHTTGLDTVYYYLRCVLHMLSCTYYYLCLYTQNKSQII